MNYKLNKKLDTVEKKEDRRKLKEDKRELKKKKRALKKGEISAEQYFHDTSRQAEDLDMGKSTYSCRHTSFPAGVLLIISATPPPHQNSCAVISRPSRRSRALCMEPSK